MHLLKLLFQKLQIRAILAPGRDSRPPGALLKITPPRALLKIAAWGQVEASPAFVFQGIMEDHQPLGTANCLGL